MNETASQGGPPALVRESYAWPSGGSGAPADSAHSTWMILFSIGMIFGPTIGYISQLRHVQASKTADGYAPLVSVILLVCNTLRVLYWLGSHYAVMLLLQSLAMIAVQLLLIVAVLKTMICARMGSISGGGTANSSAGGGFAGILLQWSPKEFLMRYFIFVTAATMMMMMMVLNSHAELASAVGYLALGIEATLVMPQIVMNFERKSVAGVSLVLVATWCVGDVVKVIYFVLFDQPEPFVVCGVFQLLCDVVVVAQLWRYRRTFSTIPSSLGSASVRPPSTNLSNAHVAISVVAATPIHNVSAAGPSPPLATPTLLHQQLVEAAAHKPPPLAKNSSSGAGWRSEWL
jgi:hypothetical protein